MSVDTQTAVELSIDGQSIQVPAGTTIWEAARRAGIDIPVLCHHPNLNPVAVCRVCAVEVEGARARRCLHSPGRARHAGTHHIRPRRALASHARRTAHGGSPLAPCPATTTRHV